MRKCHMPPFQFHRCTDDSHFSLHYRKHQGTFTTIYRAVCMEAKQRQQSMESISGYSGHKAGDTTDEVSAHHTPVHTLRTIYACVWTGGGNQCTTWRCEANKLTTKPLCPLRYSKNYVFLLQPLFKLDFAHFLKSKSINTKTFIKNY